MAMNHHSFNSKWWMKLHRLCPVQSIKKTRKNRVLNPFASESTNNTHTHARKSSKKLEAKYQIITPMLFFLSVCVLFLSFLFSFFFQVFYLPLSRSRSAYPGCKSKMPVELPPCWNRMLARNGSRGQKGLYGGSKGGVVVLFITWTFGRWWKARKRDDVQ